mmetsp:Transcript_4682/g.11542  ORF Transcript_4682/g.11542 Transcript_4682/m.11542 type:complete len:245 (+) Transcript_4682:425-1159(+)
MERPRKPRSERLGRLQGMLPPAWLSAALGAAAGAAGAWAAGSAALRVLEAPARPNSWSSYDCEKPVAMMVTLMMPSYASSTTAPKMMLHEGSARLVTTSDTRLTSCRVRSLPPVMLYTMPVARSMERWMSGAAVALSAACSARSLPDATPTPSMAVPLFDMMAFTSAKSTLIRPGTVMMSEIPCTPWRSTSSARPNASCRAVPSDATSSRRSLGMTMTESTLWRSASMPSPAWLERRRPSKEKG